MKKNGDELEKLRIEHQNLLENFNKIKNSLNSEIFDLKSQKIKIELENKQLKRNYKFLQPKTQKNSISISFANKFFVIQLENFKYGALKKSHKENYTNFINFFSEKILIKKLKKVEDKKFLKFFYLFFEKSIIFKKFIRKAISLTVYRKKDNEINLLFEIFANITCKDSVSILCFYKSEINFLTEFANKKFVESFIKNLYFVNKLEILNILEKINIVKFCGNKLKKELIGDNILEINDFEIKECEKIKKNFLF